MKLLSRLFPLFLLLLITGQFQWIDSADPTQQPASQSQSYQIAFISKRDDSHYQIYVINDDGSNEKKLTDGNADAYYPTWSPDGSQLLYLTRQGNKNPIWITNADGSGQELVSVDCDPNILPAWSPDAAKILFVAKRDRQTGIFTVNLDTRETIRLTDKSVEATSPSWSPDGTKIIFVQKNKKKNQIFIMNSDGSDPVMLTKENIKCSDPLWSPDGQKIVFKKYPYLMTDSELYIMDSHGENQKHIAGTDGYENGYRRRPIGIAPEKYIQWISGGTGIALIRCDSYQTLGNRNYPCFSLFIAPTGAEGEEQQITSVGMNHINVPQWAADGQKFIVYGKIYHKDPFNDFPKGWDAIEIPIHNVESPAWSPDSSKIAFVGQPKYRSIYYNIYIVNADGTGMVKLTAEPSFYPVWSPQGR